MTLSGVTVLVTWTKSTANGPNPYVWIPAWSTPQRSTGSDSFTRASLATGDLFDIEFFKAAPNSGYTVTITGTTSGGQQVSRAFPGILP
ncbi:hypothetical protein [Demequina activiva]|uniref:hypothetical protein n=1 Tax=Demequina activiva TaxID=1582364 RepID=UPI001942D28A|nr:hypothetical protein [Demequina activiva]